MRLGVSSLLLDLVLGAARRWKGMFVGFAGSSFKCGSALEKDVCKVCWIQFRCGSAFPVCYLISVLGAARRWKGMFVGRAGSDFRCGSVS